MCLPGLFSKPKTPEMPAVAPAPAPTPTPTPSEVSPQMSDEARRKRLERLRSGFASTIKTGARGITGAGAELSPTGSGKTKLG
jgi:hypothetical protein